MTKARENGRWFSLNSDRSAPHLCVLSVSNKCIELFCCKRGRPVKQGREFGLFCEVAEGVNVHWLHKHHTI